MRCKRHTSGSKQRPRRSKHQGRFIHPGSSSHKLNSAGISLIAATSVTHLDRPNAPAIGGEHTLPNDIAAVVVVTIAGIIGVTVVIVVVVAVRSIQAVTQADTNRGRGKRESPMPESRMEAAAETAGGEAATKSGCRK